MSLPFTGPVMTLESALPDSVEASEMVKTFKSAMGRHEQFICIFDRLISLICCENLLAS